MMWHVARACSSSSIGQAAVVPIFYLSFLCVCTSGHHRMTVAAPSAASVRQTRQQQSPVIGILVRQAGRQRGCVVASVVDCGGSERGGDKERPSGCRRGGEEEEEEEEVDDDKGNDATGGAAFCQSPCVCM
eukprot:GHVU01067556.1.p1 GENE.GHVU01067556.1~~GHVU01067556.1.p1  ORF type:complete len:131 (+),score=24.80 GHVU01067556.1:1111-1503(+)